MYQTNQMREWESSELLVVESYWIAVGAKTLHVVDETFCSVPTDEASCQYLVRLTSGASTTWYKRAKKKRDPKVVCRSPLRCLSQPKNGEEEKEESMTVRLAYLSLRGSFYFILEFLLDS